MVKAQRLGALTAIALFVLSLSVNCLQWLTLPPFPSWDASRLGLYAHDLLQENLHPFYLYHQYGPHPLIVYLQALAFAAFGYSMETLQGVTIVGEALAAPAMFWACRLLFRDEGASFAYRVGMIAALGYALSGHAASFSRLGIEGVLLPVLELIAVAFLWRGFRREQWTDFALAGILVGVIQYVYIAARFFPVALAIATLGAMLVNRQLSAHWRRLILVPVASTLVALPQLILFAAFPYTFTARVSSPDGTSGGSLIFELPEPFSALAAKLGSQASAVFWLWDTWYNTFTPKSLLTLILAIGLVTGIAVTVIRRRDAFVFGLVLMVMMLLPDLLTYVRRDLFAIGSNRFFPGVPFIFMMAGLGSASIWAAIEGRRRLPNWVGYLLPGLVLLSGLFRHWVFATQWDYANQVRPEVLEVHDRMTTLSRIAEYINNNRVEPILLPGGLFRNAPLVLMLADSFPSRKAGYQELLHTGANVTVIQANARLLRDVVSPDEWVLLSNGTVYFLPPVPDSIEPLESKEHVIDERNGIAVAKAIKARWQGTLPTYIHLRAQFANNLSLDGYLSSDLEPETPLRLALFWKPENEIKRDVEIFVQLYDPALESVVARTHTWPLEGVYRVRAWQPGRIMPLNLSLPIPDKLTPGRYLLNVGVYDLLARKRVPLMEGGDTLTIKAFKVSLPKDNRTPEIGTEVNFGNVIALDGYTITPTSEGLKISLFWRAISQPRDDYTTFIHITNSNDQIVIQKDAQPFGGRYQTSIWTQGEIVVDEHIVSPVPQGDYRIFVGWYRHQEEGWERLQIVSDDASTANDRLLLAQ